MPASEYTAWAKYDALEPICSTRVMERLIGMLTYITAVGAGVRIGGGSPRLYDFLPWSEEQPEPIESIHAKLQRMGFVRHEHE